VGESPSFSIRDQQAVAGRGVPDGRAAFYDLFRRARLGGVISGDEITVDWDGSCACGRTSVHIGHDIVQYSEKQGVEDDRISCSATQQVNDERSAFLRASKDRAHSGALFLRGEVIEDEKIGSSSAGVAADMLSFSDPHRWAGHLPLGKSMDLGDLHAVAFAGSSMSRRARHALDFETIRTFGQAYEAGLVATNYPARCWRRAM